MALLNILNVEGDASEDSDTITETWYCEYSDVQFGYNLSYPAIGVEWRGSDMSQTNTGFICTTIKYNRENTRFYGNDYLGNYKEGKDVVTIQATYKKNYQLSDDPFSLKIASAGYQNYKIMSSGTWGIINKPCGFEAGKYEIKIPILQYDLSTVVVGTPDISKYYNMVGKINSTAVTRLGISAVGTVMFESFSLVPNYANGEIIDSDLTLTFKVLSQDWNYEWRNPVQAVNQYDNKPMTWQNRYPNRADYTTTASKVNMPIWSGEIQGFGDSAYGTCGWDYRKWDFGTAQTPDLRPVYQYANLNTLFTDTTAEEEEE